MYNICWCFDVRLFILWFQTCSSSPAQELENLRDSLEESVSSTAAQQEIRAQRENELAQFKRTLEEETANHEATVSSMRQKHSKAIEDLNEQLEAARKVRWCRCTSWKGERRERVDHEGRWEKGEGVYIYELVCEGESGRERERELFLSMQRWIGKKMKLSYEWYFPG